MSKVVALRVPPPDVSDERSVDETVTAINKNYGLLLLGEKVRVVKLDTMTFLTVGDFKSYLSNVVARASTNKPVYATDVWLRHPAMRRFDRATFMPGCDAPASICNLWRGWGVEPKPGDCSMFVEHISKIVCQGKTERYAWLMGWMADLVQKPMRKPGTAPVFMGKKGVGKSVVANALLRLVGKSHGKPVSHANHVVGHFNGHLEDCLLLVADEAFWAASKQAEGVLKQLITEDEITIERKGIDPYSAPNYTRVLICSNEDWVVPATVEERRFAVFDVSDAHRQDHKYFGELQEHLDNGGYEALLYELLQWPYDETMLRSVPQTSALRDQQRHTLSRQLGWLADLLRNGVLPGDAEGTGESINSALYNHYVTHAHKAGQRDRGLETELGAFLKKFFGDRITPGRRSSSLPDGRTKREYTRQFPALHICRQLFDENTAKGIVEWPDGDDNDEPAWGAWDAPIA
jgi:hypothetical protein